MIVTAYLEIESKNPKTERAAIANALCALRNSSFSGREVVSAQTHPGGQEETCRIAAFGKRGGDGTGSILRVFGVHVEFADFLDKGDAGDFLGAWWIDKPYSQVVLVSAPCGPDGRTHEPRERPSFAEQWPEWVRREEERGVSG
jgi:hypothetical protein